MKGKEKKTWKNKQNKHVHMLRMWTDKLPERDSGGLIR